MPNTPKKRHLGHILRRGFGSAPVFLLVVLMSLIVGCGVYLLNPMSSAGNSDSTTSAPQDDNSHIISAGQSLSSAKTTFSMLSTGINDASGSISTITDSASQTFDAVDTAKLASDDLVVGTENLPDLSQLSTEVSTSTQSISNAIIELQTLSATAGDVESMVNPVIHFIETNNIPDSGDALQTLNSLKESSKSIRGELSNLEPLQAELNRVRDSTVTSTDTLNNAIGKTRESARQLQTGFSTLASAREDTVASANQVSSGVNQLKTVMGSIQRDLDSSLADLSAEMEKPAAPSPVEQAETQGERVSIALLAGAIAGLAVLLAWALASRGMWRRNISPEDGDPSHVWRMHDLTTDDEQTDSVEVNLLPKYLVGSAPGK